LLGMNMPVPQVINGRYEILGPLGAGGQGTTWAVRDLYQGEEVALKLIGHEFGPWQEAQVLTALRDRHILPVRNADYVAGVKFLVTELARNGTVERPIATQGARGIEQRQAVRWARQTCEGLVRTHATGLLHNDIKPANIFLDAVGEALLGDFGLAMLVDSQGTTAAAGTFETMAPEVATRLSVPGARPCTLASDIYSLGATLYWMLTGSPPYQPLPGQSVAQLAAQAARNTPVALRDRAPHVSQTLGERVNRAMASDPADRYVGASAFGAALGTLPAATRQWTRTDECGGHWGCWRGLRDGHAAVLVCAIPAGPNKYELRGLKLPSGTRIRKVTRTVTQRQLPAGIRGAIKVCS
jgi:serine/threonine-protein kinase